MVHRSNGRSRSAAATESRQESGRPSPRPRTGQRAPELQEYGTIARLPIGLDESVCKESVEALNQVLADTITLRDLYKKPHWQVAGHTFYQLHLLFDKHYEEQDELVDQIAERIQLLGRHQPGDGRRRRRGDPDPAAAARARGSAGADLPPAGGPRADPDARARGGRKGRRGGRRRHQRPAGQRRHPHQRAAGLVPGRASGGRAGASEARSRSPLSDGGGPSPPR